LVYTTALEKGFTAASIVNDAPIVHDAQLNGNEWRPENFSHKFSGPTRLRDALRTSRNLVSIRLMRDIGIQTVRKTALRFGFPEDQLPASLTLALGSGTASPLQMARTYATFANGGYRIDPYFIQRIEDVDGEVIFEAEPKQACSGCSHSAPRIIDEGVHYLMHSMLQDVVRRGTATKANVLRRSDMAGKTGTTNDQRDAWFNGYAANLVAIAWVGFDSSAPLGRSETGTRAALPIWIKFMRQALQGKPALTFVKPDNIVQLGIDPETGLLATKAINNAVSEIFRSEQAPKTYTNRSTQTFVDPKGTQNEVEPLF
jgi:penicillin-binding protein 1A